MRRLYILRHAKSSWDDPDLPDHERPLNARGEKAAALVAEHVASAGIAPDLVLCSTALRARQTLAALLPVLAGEPVIRLEDGLYGAGFEDVLVRLRAVDAGVTAVLLVGHNPTLHELALVLTGREDALDRYPTGALATVAIACEWPELAAGRGELEALALPRELDR